MTCAVASRPGKSRRQRPWTTCWQYGPGGQWSQVPAPWGRTGPAGWFDRLPGDPLFRQDSPDGLGFLTVQPTGPDTPHAAYLSSRKWHGQFQPTEAYFTVERGAVADLRADALRIVERPPPFAYTQQPR